MKAIHILKMVFFISLLPYLFSSCNQDTIEELENRISELEALAEVKDSVLFGDLVISSQTSMDIMTERGITNILGMLIIQNCTDLTPLSNLKSVEGLQLEIPSGLTTLEGLNNLTQLNTLVLYFNGNSNVDISALDGLVSIDNLYLEGAIPNVSWFNSIATLESFYVNANTSNLTFNGLESLESVDYLSINNWEGNLIVQGFEKLTSLIDLNISANNLTLSGFDNINSINYLNIYGNTLSISGLNSIRSLDYLSINGSSIDISGLNGISSLSYLSFYANTLNLSGFSSLETLDGLDVFVENSASGLSKLKTIGYLYLGIGSSNNFLTGLTTVGNIYVFSYSNNIKSFSDIGLTNLQSIGGIGLDIPSLESLDGIDLSNSTLNDFSVFNCPKLIDISAMSTYSGSINYFNLWGTSLASLDGLENVTSFDYLSINNNSKLDDWCGIKDVFDAIPSSQRDINNNLSNPNSSADIVGCN